MAASEDFAGAELSQNMWTDRGPERTPAEVQGLSLYHTLKIETSMSFSPSASGCSFSRVADTSSMKENALLGKIP